MSKVIRIPLRDTPVQRVAADADLEAVQCSVAFQREPTRLDEELEVQPPNKEG